MKKIALLSVVLALLFCALLGFAPPAQAQTPPFYIVTARSDIVIIVWEDAPADIAGDNGWVWLYDENGANIGYCPTYFTNWVGPDKYWTTSGCHLPFETRTIRGYVNFKTGGFGGTDPYQIFFLALPHVTR